MGKLRGAIEALRTPALLHHEVHHGLDEPTLPAKQRDQIRPGRGLPHLKRCTPQAMTEAGEAFTELGVTWDDPDTDQKWMAVLRGPKDKVVPIMRVLKALQAHSSASIYHQSSRST